MNKLDSYQIELNIELLKGNADGFKKLLDEQPGSPVKERIERQIGALEMAIFALEKQIPSKFDKVFCPRCNTYLELYEGESYCCHCGQKLDWRNKDE